MTALDNAKFQQLVLEKLTGLQNKIDHVEKEMKQDLMNVKTRQDETYHVVTAIEHSNQVGKSELDSQNIRLAKVEGKFKRVARAFDDEIEVDKASNL